MCLILDEMEQDLVLACKNWYGENGIEKVIGNYCGYDPKDCNISAKYHFISELLMKLLDNKCITLTRLFDELSPRHINGFGGMDEHLHTSTKIYNRMVSVINNLQVRNQDEVLVELHQANEKFKEKEIV